MGLMANASALLQDALFGKIAGESWTKYGERMMDESTARGNKIAEEMMSKGKLNGPNGVTPMENAEIIARTSLADIKDFYLGGSVGRNARRIGTHVGVHMGTATGLRYASGGTFAHNKNGDRDIAGIPFI